MAVQNISHDAEGFTILRVPVEHKVALGLPKGYKSNPQAREAPAPQKLFHFLVQSRDDNGDWAYDKALAKRIFGGDEASHKKPKEIKIQLIGNKIEDMVYSDLFYWSTSQGAKCSSKIIKPYLQQWCEDNNIPWKKPLSRITTVLELKLLIESKKIDDRLKAFIEDAEKWTEVFKNVMGEDYDIETSDFINANVAYRKPNAGGPMKLYPCTFRKCPDFDRGFCKYNGRFFFVFDGDDIGEVVTLVTTSPTNVQNIQWGLANIIERVLKDRVDDGGKALTMHGISCRLTGKAERGSYAGKGGQASTKFFRVKLKGPAETITGSASIIIKQANEMSKLYPGGVVIKFDEGDEMAIAKERILEFHENDESKLPKADKSEKAFRVRDEKIKQDTKKKKDTEFSDKVDELIKRTKKIKKDKQLVHMIEIFSTAVNGLNKSNGLKQLTDAFMHGLVEESVTVDQILKSQEKIKKLGSDIDFAKELDVFNNKSKKENK